MKKRQLGKSDLMVSEIGFGSMSVPPTEKESSFMIHKAIDEGVNFIDTADLYGFGEIETLIGKALKSRKRDEVILATKVGNRWDNVDSGWEWDPSKKYIKKEIHASLKRLQTDYIDLYQLHGGTLDDPMEETIEAFEELKKEGLIRHYGISSIRPNVIQYYLKNSNIVSIMMQFSLLDRRPEQLFPLIDSHDVSVIARGPVAKGWLSERVYKKSDNDNYLSHSKPEIERVVDHLIKLSKQTEKANPSQFALKYPLAFQTVATVIPGASKLEQLLNNIAADDIANLSQEQLYQLQELTRHEVYENHRI